MSLFCFLNRKTKEDTRNTVNDIVPEKLILTRATRFEVAIHCKHRSGKTQKLKKKNTRTLFSCYHHIRQSEFALLNLCLICSGLLLPG